MKHSIVTTGVCHSNTSVNRKAMACVVTNLRHVQWGCMADILKDILKNYSELTQMRSVLALARTYDGVRL